MQLDPNDPSLARVRNQLDAYCGGILNRAPQAALGAYLRVKARFELEGSTPPSAAPAAPASPNADRLQRVARYL